MIKESTEIDFIITALENLAPAGWVLRGDNIIWRDELDEFGNKTGQLTAGNIKWDTETPPTKDELEAEILRVKQEYNSTVYQRQRQPEYPPLADLADALYWQSTGDNSKMDAYLTKVAAVKSKYPKE